MGFGRLNERGNWIEEDNFFYRDRYYYDLHVCNSIDWTTLEVYAPYFGVWYNSKERIIITFAEGDETRVHCISQEKFQDELDAMFEFYNKAA